MKTIKLVVIVVLLLLGIFVALSPSLVYAPTPRIVLYFLLSFLPGLLFGAEASSRFKLELPGFAFTTAGACAACLGVMLLLTHLSKPEEKIAVFQVYDEDGGPIPLDWSGAIDIPVTPQGITITKFIQGNTVILVFPEQVGEAEVRIKKDLSSPAYSGSVGYSGTRTSKLTLGTHLKSN